MRQPVEVALLVLALACCACARQRLQEPIRALEPGLVLEPAQSLKPAVASAVNAAVETTAKPANDPVIKPAFESVMEPNDEPVKNKTEKPIIALAVEPFIKSTVDPVSIPTFVPDFKPNVGPVFIPSLGPVFVPSTDVVKKQPAMEFPPKPAFEYTVEPAVKPTVREPVAKPAKTSAVEPFQEPVRVGTSGTGLSGELVDVLRRKEPAFGSESPVLKYRHEAARPGYQDELMTLTAQANAALAVQFAALPLIENLAHNILNGGATYTQEGFQIYDEATNWWIKYHLEVASWKAAQKKCALTYDARLYSTTHGTQLDGKMATLYPSLRPWIGGVIKHGPKGARFCPYLSYNQGAGIKYDNCRARRPFICELFVWSEDEDHHEHGHEHTKPSRPDHPRPPRPDQSGPRPPRPDQSGPRPPRPDHSGPRPPRPGQSGPRPPRPDPEHPRPPRPDHEHPDNEHPDHGHPGHKRPEHHERPEHHQVFQVGGPGNHQVEVEIEISLVDQLRTNLLSLMDIIKALDNDRIRVSPALRAEPLAVLRDALALISSETLAARLAKLSQRQRAQLAVEVNAHALQLRNVAMDPELLRRFLTRDASGQQPLVVRLRDLLVQLEMLR